MPKSVIAVISASIALALGFTIGALIYRTDRQETLSRLEAVEQSLIANKAGFQSLKDQIDQLNSSINNSLKKIPPLPLTGDEYSIIESTNHAPYWLKDKTKLFVGGIRPRLYDLNGELFQKSSTVYFKFTDASADGIISGGPCVFLRPVGKKNILNPLLLEAYKSNLLINGWLPVRLKLNVSKPFIVTATLLDGTRFDSRGVTFGISDYQLLKPDFSGWDAWYRGK